ncbi:ATP-binding cassette superfamily [Zopfochytrium polystomum]|nr:ATP-binding cassette superfamily [Zopfochytrium polystomum]
MKLLVTLAAAVIATAAGVFAVEEETKTLSELHADAVAEGGVLTIYAGGDINSQQDSLRTLWKAAFPDVNLTIIVDYSKYHDVRIDNQLERDLLIPDIAFLQTLQNFPRWAARGDLLAYKPAGFSQIYDGFKDPDGFWAAHQVITFGFSYDAAQLGNLTAPSSPLDLVDPRWTGKVASAYPNDDDASLFVYKKFVEKYGWDWLQTFTQQRQVEYARGTNTPGAAVSAKRKAVAFASSINLVPAATATVQPVFGNGVPFLAWGQRLAIFKKAPHPAAAKLFISWILSKDVQTNSFGSRSVRTDVVPPLGPGNFTWNIPEANVAEFPAFMADRAEVERWRQKFSLYIGEVQGPPSPGWFGLFPGK